MSATYNIVMFAYNEEKNISRSIQSVYDNTNANLGQFHIVANGCTDSTAEVAESTKARIGFDKLNVTSLQLGDKCNAWNHYIHNLAENADVHFFVDADVQFSSHCFEKLCEKLATTQEQTVAIAGLPLSGRNIAFYRSLVIERSCFFGNLYGLKNSFLTRIKETPFYMPVGLNWIDSFLTKAVNTDLDFKPRNLPGRVTYLEGVGYQFDSLSPFKLDDIKLYINRIARYELGKIQEIYLDKLNVSDWPREMRDINMQIKEKQAQHLQTLPFIKRYLVARRLNKIINRYTS